MPPDTRPGSGGWGAAGRWVAARARSAAAVGPPAPRTYSRHAWPVLAAGSALAVATVAVPGYWRTTWWAWSWAAVLGAGSALAAVLVARRGLAARAILPLVLLADGAVVVAASCVRDAHGAGMTIVLFALPTVIVALFGTARLLVGQAVAIASGAAAVLYLAGDPVQVLVVQDLVALVSTVSPAVTILALRHHLEVALRAERRLATTDQLTATTNRWGMDAAVTRVAGLAAGRGLPVGVLVADVDHFKRINDEHGHPVGDEVLRRVAEAMGACIRAEDHLVRLGGEEFAVLAVLGPLALTGLAERLRRHVQVRCATWQLTVSIGVAWGDVDIGRIAGAGGAGAAPRADEGAVVEQVWSLIGRADAALLQAKRAGRNRVRIAHPGAEAGAGTRAAPGVAVDPGVVADARADTEADGTAAVDVDRGADVATGPLC